MLLAVVALAATGSASATSASDWGPGFKEYPGWVCFSGTPGGTCTKGKKVAAYSDLGTARVFPGGGADLRRTVAGGVIAFAGRPPNCHECHSFIYDVDPDGGRPSRMAIAVPAADPYFSRSFVWDPVLSRTGPTMLFGGRFGIFTSTGPGSPTLQAAVGGPHGPAFVEGTLSPDGSTVLGANLSDRYLFSVPAAGGTVTPIRGTGRFVDPSFFPDGKRLLAVRQQYHPVGTRVYSMNLDGSHRRAIPNTRYLQGEPLVSPDGRWILASQAISEPIEGSRKWARWGVFMLTIDGSRLHRVGTIVSTEQAPELSFSPDGRQIAVVRYLGGGKLHSQLLVMNVDGSHVKRLPTPGIDPSHPSWGVLPSD